MSLSLTKGQHLSLEKAASGKDYFVVGMGWAQGDYDLDTFAVLCKQQADGSSKVIGEPSFIYFNQLESSCKGVKHMGDDLVGGGDGDCEQIHVDVKNLDTRIDQIDFFVTIYHSTEKKQHFGQVGNAYVRIGTCDRLANGIQPDVTEVARFNLSEDYSGQTAIQAGSLYKDQSTGEWKFQAMGQGLGQVEIGDIFEQYCPGITK